MVRGRPGKLPPPVDSIDDHCSPAERAAIDQRTRFAAVGSPETVRRRLQEFITQTQADEIIATGQIYDHAARLRSFEIAAEVFDSA
jgi:alkanesulfonate monooxygenase SsuD/methylene tetrahydromethanopterin reductase-like flavin-dependent oxidoreductase (luciferase family)